MSLINNFKISQSLVKEVAKDDHCPKKIYFMFEQGLETEPTDAMLMGRYFESELLGCCRGGQKQEAHYITQNKKPSKTASKSDKINFLKSKNVDYENKTSNELSEIIDKFPDEIIKVSKTKPFLAVDENVKFARELISNLGLNLEEGESQINEISEFLSGAIDHRNKDLNDNSILANYDVKWTATKPDDNWNGWGNPQGMTDMIIQATHYTLVTYETKGVYMPFYFLVFGRDNWAKVVNFVITNKTLTKYQNLLFETSYKIRQYIDTGFTGNGNYNKCVKCPFNNICEDKKIIPEIEIYEV